MHATLAPTGHATEPDQRAEAGLRRRGTPALRTESRARKTTPGGGAFDPSMQPHMAFPLEVSSSGKNSKTPVGQLRRGLPMAARQGGGVDAMRR